MRTASVLRMVFLSLALLTVAPICIHIARADPPASKPDTICVKVEHVTFTHAKQLLAPDLLQHLQQDGVSTEESPSEFFVPLAAAIASRKASVSESYLLNLPACAPIVLRPGSKSQIGLDLAVGPPAANGQLQAEVGVNYRGRTLRHTVLAPSGSLVAFRLNPEESVSGSLELAVLILTRLPHG